MVQLITCDPDDGASLIVEPLDECGDIMGGDLFRCEACELQEATREKWELKYPVDNADVFTFDEIIGARNLRQKIDALSAGAQEWLHRIVQQIGEGVEYDPNDELRAECAIAGLLTIGKRGAIEISSDVMTLVYTQNYLAY